MYKMITLTVAGLVAGLFTLATPSTSQAQGINFGLQFQRGGYSSGCNPGYYGGGYGGYQGYGAAYGGHHGGHHGGSLYGGYNSGYYGRPTIVHPSHGHWTPWQGYHQHGHIHTPHRGHYHTYRY